MPQPRRTALIATLLLIVLAVFAASSILFATQGGMGGGHGRFDFALFLLGLPWMAIVVVIPWPESLWLGDYVMTALLPLAFNLCCVVVLHVVLRRRF